MHATCLLGSRYLVLLPTASFTLSGVTKKKRRRTEILFRKKKYEKSKNFNKITQYTSDYNAENKMNALACKFIQSPVI